MSAPASSGGTGMGGTIFEPRNQGAADQSLAALFGPLFDMSAGGGAGTPAAQNYPAAQGAVYGDILNPGFQNQAIAGSQAAYDSAFGRTAPQAFGGADQLYNTATTGLPFAGRALAQGFDPRYDAAITGIENNPYYGQALGGAQAAAGMGAEGAGAMMGMGRQIGGTINPLLESGFDPRSALFNRTQGRLMDQTNAINSMAGISGTPYGASVGANAMGNFDIDWQNQQQQRQIAGANAAGGAANTAAGLYGAAPGLMSSTAAGPSNVYTGHIGQILGALNSRNQGAQQGISNFGAMLGDAGRGFGQANAGNMMGTGAQQTYGSAPYNTAAGIGGTSLQGLAGLTSLGNNRFQLPQQQIGNLENYMSGGRQASMDSGQLGQMGFNQTAEGIGGALSGANMMFGRNGMFGGGGAFGGLGDLFGGGGGALDMGGVAQNAAGLGAATGLDFETLLMLGLV